MEVNPFSIQPIKVLLLAQTIARCNEAENLFFKEAKPTNPKLKIIKTYPGVPFVNDHVDCVVVYIS
jgi:hypothetical protein